jgi:hypothetical protein
MSFSTPSFEFGKLIISINLCSTGRRLLTLLRKNMFKFVDESRLTPNIQKFLSLHDLSIYVQQSVSVRFNVVSCRVGLQIVGPLRTVVSSGSCLYRLHAWPLAQGMARGPVFMPSQSTAHQTDNSSFHQMLKYFIIFTNYLSFLPI